MSYKDALLLLLGFFNPDSGAPNQLRLQAGGSVKFPDGTVQSTAATTTATDLATTTSPVNVSAAAAPSTGKVLTATDATHATWQTPTGGGGAGTLVTLKETVFAGMTPQSFADNSFTTLDGSSYHCELATSDSADIVASGLRLRQGTTGGAGSSVMRIGNGSIGDFTSIVGEARFRRGRWGIWSRIASYDYTNAGASCFGGVIALGATGKWGVGLRNRVKNILGAPNNATGGIAFDFWWNGSNPSPGTYPGLSTADTILAYFRSPTDVDVYYGTYSGGWPTMEAMTLMGSIQMRVVQTATGANYGTLASSIDLWWQLGGSSATSGTYEMIFDRWRITAWE